MYVCVCRFFLLCVHVCLCVREYGKKQGEKNRSKGKNENERQKKQTNTEAERINEMDVNESGKLPLGGKK